MTNITRAIKRWWHKRRASAAALAAIRWEARQAHYRREGDHTAATNCKLMAGDCRERDAYHVNRLRNL